MVLSDIVERVKSLAVKNVISKPLASTESSLRQHKILSRVVGGCVAIVLCLLAILMMPSRESGQKSAPKQKTVQLDTGRAITIPPEELFLPDEPDFLPTVILEREPRKWSAEDALPFWTNPLKNNPGQWQDDIKSVVDEIMERVP
jgi:hypothetical protein